MKIFKYMILLFLILLTFSFCAKKQQSQQTEYGELIYAYLKNAPFPDKDRNKGYSYKDKFYSFKEHYDDNKVAIFIPKDYSPDKKIDFVVHFHGWFNDVDSVLKTFKLLEQFAGSKKNAILIVPQGPKNAPDSFGGKLTRNNGFKLFMNEIMTVLKDRNYIPHKSKLGDIILTGHSGGYKVIANILSKGGLVYHIHEVYLFDALYGNIDDYTNWLNKSASKFFIIYTDSGGTIEGVNKFVSELQNHGISFYHQQTSKVKKWELKKKEIMLLHSNLGHNDVLYKRKMFQRILANSQLERIKSK